MARTSFTVTELNAHIKQLLDADALLGNVCVTGNCPTTRSIRPDIIISRSRTPRAVCGA
ncbi:MAG: hypothetical protein ACLR1P_07490 [Oscillospiraceae bacterium]